MLKFYKILLSVFFLGMCFSGFSQKLTVTGKVTGENGEPLPGANVLVKGTTVGTVTDVDGNYSLGVTNENVTLIVSYVGFLSQEILLNGRIEVNVSLVPDLSTLSEIVVVGYGTVKKSDLTGSVASVKSEELTALPTINAVQGLTGRAAGVQVIQNSGEPGANISVRIRGGNSLQGNNEPLYVIDGFPISGGPTSINPNDIESVEVLKDASATAIYGSRGANGVVIITTKSGKAGRSRVDIESYYGFQQEIDRIDMLNAEQFARIANERAANDGDAPFFTDAEIQSFGEGTDWQEEVFRTAPIQNHVVTFSGGNENTTYSVSGSWFDQEGIIIGSEYQRGSLRANLNHKINDKLTFAYSSILSRINSNRLRSDNGSRGRGVLSSALLAPPILAVRDDEGNYTDPAQFAFSPGVAENAVAQALELLNENTVNSILANSSLNYEFLEGLSFKVSLGIESIDSKRDQFSPSIFKNSPTGDATTSFFRRTNLLNENILTYTKSFADHELIFTGGFTYQTERTTNNSSGSTGFTNDILRNDRLQAGDTPKIPTSSVTEWTIVSWLGRVNYTLKDKYLFTASVRADGSSRFGEANKWGVFPSGAFAWRLSDEQFIQNVSAISNLKLRTSWGQTGSTAVAPYQTLNTLNSSLVVFNDAFFTGFAPGSRLPNPDLKWETTTQFDIGVDFGLFEERLRFSADYYVKNTKDLLATVPLPTSVGFTNVTQNIGEIKNQGIELTIGADILVDALKWTVDANLAANTNEAVSLAGGSDVFGARLDNPLQTSVNIVREGEPVGAFFGFVEQPLLDDNGQIQYVDQNGDDIINNDDKVIIGNPNPDLIFGLNSNFSYKNFDLNLFIQGVQGVDIFNFNAAQHANSFNFGINQITDILNRWTPENPDPTAPYPVVSVNTQFRESDRFVEDGSFVRLKNIRLAYNFPLENVKWLQRAQVYVSGQNLLTFTDYSWYDPEVSTRGGGNSISQGIDQFGYPTTKTYTLGIQLGF